MSITFTLTRLDKEANVWHHIESEHEVNVSNSNAMLILATLAIEFDHCGAVGPIELLKRAAHADIHGDHGYTADKVERLIDLAGDAIKRDMQIGWS